MGGSSNPVKSVTRTINRAIGRPVRGIVNTGKGVVAPVIKNPENIIKNPVQTIVTNPISTVGDKIGVGNDITNVIDRGGSIIDKTGQGLITDPVNTIGEIPGKVNDALITDPLHVIGRETGNIGEDIIHGIGNAGNEIGKAVKKILTPGMPPIPTGGDNSVDNGGGDQGPLPGTGDNPPSPGMSPNPSSLAEMMALRRLRALRRGLLSTITSSPWGVTGAPNLLTPSAGAGQVKTVLG